MRAKRKYTYWAEYYDKEGKKVKGFMKAENISQAREIVEGLSEEGTLYSVDSWE